MAHLRASTGTISFRKTLVYERTGMGAQSYAYDQRPAQRACQDFTTHRYIATRKMTNLVRNSESLRRRLRNDERHEEMHQTGFPAGCPWSIQGFGHPFRFIASLCWKLTVRFKENKDFKTTVAHHRILVRCCRRSVNFRPDEHSRSKY